MSLPEPELGASPGSGCADLVVLDQVGPAPPSLRGALVAPLFLKHGPVGLCNRLIQAVRALLDGAASPADQSGSTRANKRARMSRRGRPDPDTTVHPKMERFTKPPHVRSSWGG